MKMYRYGVFFGPYFSTLQWKIISSPNMGEKGPEKFQYSDNFHAVNANEIIQTKHKSSYQIRLSQFFFFEDISVFESFQKKSLM